MSISAQLKDYLEKEGVPYRHKIHAPAYTSQEIAAVEHIPGRELAKSVILRADDELLMAVLPACDVVNLEALKSEIGSKILRLAREDEFREAFPTCEVGAMPPFGNIFGLAVYCDVALEKDREIEFNAGTHTDTIRMNFADFKRLANPRMARFGQKQTGQAAQRIA